jgi:hypothetical protein
METAEGRRMAETCIPVTETTLARLEELARWAGVSVPEALEQAVKDHHDRKFRDAVNAGYAALRADAASAELEAERWDDDGGAQGPTGQDRGS